MSNVIQLEKITANTSKAMELAFLHTKTSSPYQCAQQFNASFIHESIYHSLFSSASPLDESDITASK